MLLPVVPNDGPCLCSQCRAHHPERVVDLPEIEFDELGAEVARRWGDVTLELGYCQVRAWSPRGALIALRDLYAGPMDRFGLAETVGTVQLLRVVDGSGPHYLKVPAEINTVLEALAWTFRLEPADYNPLVET